MGMRPAAQMYTLREFTGTREGLREALRRCREMGYEGVQLSAVGCMSGNVPEVSAAEARGMLDEAGLVCCATHRPWARLRDATEEEITFHRTLGCDYVAVGSLHGDYGQAPEDYRRFMADAEPVARALRAAGIRFGYHNHAHEFASDPATGRPCYDILIEEGGPDLQLEVDTYWVAHAGHDPARLLERCVGRIAVVHLKDRGTAGEMAPVGEGELDWPAILGACKAGGTEWACVEQDVCRRDPFDCLRSSREFLGRRWALGH